MRLGSLVHENMALLLMRRQSLAHFEVSSYDGVMELGKNDASPKGNSSRTIPSPRLDRCGLGRPKHQRVRLDI